MNRIALGLGLLALAPAASMGQDADAGKVVYDQWCAGCHGLSGDGQGAAAPFMLPPPRDFTRGLYQIRTTGSGDLPTDDDIRQVILNGMPGTTMPAWRDKFSSGEVGDLIAYLKTFNRFFDGADPQPLEFGREPGGPSPDDLAEGRRLYMEELECFRCHGNEGRGDGASGSTLTDDWDVPIYAADLSENWNFNGGGEVADIYRRMRTGLDGTPMPSNSDVIDAGIITDEQLWRVAQYVRSLSPEQAPRRQDVIRAALAEAALPTGPDDPAWDAVDPAFVPMVGQITIAPRWFVPNVDALWVKAMHDGERLTLLFTWNDRTRSPDPEWEEFFQGVKRTLEAVDEPHLEAQGPDRLAFYTPVRAPEGTELPFFLQGDPRRPVAMSVWTSTPDELRTGTAAGLGTFAGSPAAGGHQAAFAEGQWRLQVTRPLASPDTTLAPDLVPGVNMPIAFQVSDGSNGEDAVRSAISAWYAIYLDIPTPPRVFIAPIVAVMLTAGLGMVTVWRAQRREQAAPR